MRKIERLDDKGRVIDVLVITTPMENRGTAIAAMRLVNHLAEEYFGKDVGVAVDHAVGVIRLIQRDIHNMEGGKHEVGDPFKFFGEPPAQGGPTGRK